MTRQEKIVQLIDKLLSNLQLPGMMAAMLPMLVSLYQTKYRSTILQTPDSDIDKMIIVARELLDKIEGENIEAL